VKAGSCPPGLWAEVRDGPCPASISVLTFTQDHPTSSEDDAHGPAILLPCWSSHLLLASHNTPGDPMSDMSRIERPSSTNEIR
jgi:hypothetical protein